MVRSVAAVCVLLLPAGLLAGCDPGAVAPGSDGRAEGAGAATGSGFDLAAAEAVDLTHAFGEDTIYWPTDPTGFQLETLSYGHTDGGYFYAANRFCTAEHGGTHLDAPIHFGEGQQAVDAIPVDRLIGPAVVIDVAEKAAQDADYRLAAQDVEAWEAEFGAVPAGAIVLLRTGWGARWPDRRAYLGDDAPGDASDLHFPSYGREAAELLVRERKVAALGVDTASIDHGPSQDFAVHRVAALGDVPGLENLANLDQVPPTGAWVVALPMKIGGGSGAPLRAVALLPPR
ncbi:MAG TPA: cyclase family protein [Thermoanaerobaculia bacterium]|nr:cyclase family protein [Thermoanaerobaculia bacterium]